MLSDNEFEKVLSFIPENIRNLLMQIPNEMQDDTYEIRLRKNKPLTLYGKFGTVFISENALSSCIKHAEGKIITESEIAETVAKISSYSVYSHQNDIAKGFLTFGSGFRAGICGSAVITDSKITSVKDISSINIRISRSHKGAADELITTLFDNKKLPSVILAGEPCSGKTTILREFAKRLSSEFQLGYRKTVIIDERYEFKDNEGINCDILCGYPKAEGIERAVRTLSPEMIICDEITTLKEADEINKAFNSGVAFTISLHARSFDEFINKNTALELIGSKQFDYCVFLSGMGRPGKIEKIVRTDEIFNEVYCNNDNSRKLIYDGIFYSP